jgi:hypothetical protein
MRTTRVNWLLFGSTELRCGHSYFVEDVSLMMRKRSFAVRAQVKVWAIGATIPNAADGHSVTPITRYASMDNAFVPTDQKISKVTISMLQDDIPRTILGDMIQRPLKSLPGRVDDAPLGILIAPPGHLGRRNMLGPVDQNSSSSTFSSRHGILLPRSIGTGWASANGIASVESAGRRAGDIRVDLPCCVRSRNAEEREDRRSVSRDRGRCRRRHGR